MSIRAPSDFNVHNRAASQPRLPQEAPNANQQALSRYTVSIARSEQPTLIRDSGSKKAKAASARNTSSYYRAQSSPRSPASGLFTKAKQQKQEKESAQKQLDKTMKLVDTVFAHKDFRSADTLAKSAEKTVHAITKGMIDTNKSKLALTSLCCRHLCNMKSLNPANPSQVQNISKVSDSLKKMLFESINSIYSHAEEGDLQTKNMGNKKKRKELSELLFQTSRYTQRVKDAASPPEPKFESESGPNKSKQLFNKVEVVYLDMMSKGLDKLSTGMKEKST